MDEKHIYNLNNCPDIKFTSPMVNTAKRDKLISLALDSKKLNA